MIIGTVSWEASPDGKDTTVIRRSPLTYGEERRRVMPIHVKYFEEGMQRYRTLGWKVQDAFPSLSVDDREFLLTGMTPEQWEANTKEPNDAD